MVARNSRVQHLHVDLIGHERRDGTGDGRLPAPDRPVNHTGGIEDIRTGTPRGRRRVCLKSYPVRHVRDLSYLIPKQLPDTPATARPDLPGGHVCRTSFLHIGLPKTAQRIFRNAVHNRRTTPGPAYRDSGIDAFHAAVDLQRARYDTWVTPLADGRGPARGDVAAGRATPYLQ